MDEEKHFWQSRTVWGGIISLSVFFLSWAGYAVSGADKATLVDDMTALVGIFGSLLAIYGRVVATKTIRR